MSMACPYCGSADQAGETLCTACGRNRVELRCKRCRFVNPPGVRFCGDCGARLADQAVADADDASEAERRQLTVLFCDLIDSVGLSRRLDPEDYRELLQHYRDTCTRVFHHYEGTQIRYVGDGIRVYFGYPRAHEDDAERAVRAGLEVIAAIDSLNRLAGESWTGRLAVRIGIATGLVVAGWLNAEGRHESEAVGETPNLAARLQSLAPPGAVVVGDSTRRLLGRLFEIRDLGSHELKGFAEPVRAWQAIEAQARHSRFEATRSLDTPLVGRSAELARLRQNWDLACVGQGRVVQISGEAGLGKSRLARALRERLTAHHRLLYQCSPYHRNSALYPVVTQLEYAAGMCANDSAAERLDKLSGLIRRSNASPDTLLPVLATLLSIPSEGLYAPPQLSAQRLKERTFAALIELMLALAAAQPLLLIFEDLHWIDPTSEEALGRAIGAMRQARVLMLFTHRPDYQPPWSGMAHVETLQLERLDVNQTRELIERLAGSRRLPRSILDQLVRRSDGIPLFTEELTRTILEQSVLEAQPGRTGAADELQYLEVPASLKDSLMARLDQLGEAKTVAQLGAAIGRSFSFELLAALISQPEPVLRDALGRLEAANLIQKRAANGESGYMFRHALFQEAANDSLLHSRRQRMHLRIAEVMERDFPALWTNRPELLALHYSESRRPEKAVDYWLQAGRLASGRSADREAIHHLRQGLLSLDSLTDSEWRRQKRLELLIALGPPLITTEGPGSIAVRDTYQEALALCERLPESSLHFTALWGWWRRSRNFVTKAETARRLLSLAKRLRDPGLILQAHHALWATCFVLGEQRRCQRHIEQGLSLYHSGDYRHHSAIYAGHDAAVCGEGEQALTDWLLGRPDLARLHAVKALRLARRLKHAGSIVHALDYAATLYACGLQQPVLAERRARALLRYSEAQEFPDYRARAQVFLGWALAGAGDYATGIATLQQGLSIQEDTGTIEDFPIFLELLAEVFLLSGQHEAAREALDRGQAIAGELAVRLWDAELRRCWGELLLAGQDAAGAETQFQQALEIARQQQTRSLSLRAAIALARLYRDQGEAPRGLSILSPIYQAFSEGLDSPDLRRARELLSEPAR